MHSQLVLPEGIALLSPLFSSSLQSNMNVKFVFALATFTVAISQISGQDTCQRCRNGVFCQDATSYFFCLDGRNPTTATYTKCPSGQVCTDSDKICEPEGSRVPACFSSCGVCPSSAAPYQRYTCVSKSQFGLCVNGQIMITGKCDAGQICSSELYAKTGLICAPLCVTDFYGTPASCDSEEIVTTTTTAAPPVDTAFIKKQCRDALPGHPNDSIFYITNANDNECRTYIYCEKFDDDVDGLLVRCPSGNFFNPMTGRCGTQSPPVCNPATTPLPTATTTTTPLPITTTTTTPLPTATTTTTPLPITTTTTTPLPTTTTTTTPLPATTTTTPLPTTTTTTTPLPTTTTTTPLPTTTTTTTPLPTASTTTSPLPTTDPNGRK